MRPIQATSHHRSLYPALNRALKVCKQLRVQVPVSAGTSALRNEVPTIESANAAATVDRKGTLDVLSNAFVDSAVRRMHCKPSHAKFSRP
jgi:hypothetical protein